jgi:hypothetical protein
LAASSQDLCGPSRRHLEVIPSISKRYCAISLLAACDCG